jgi:hypothetical protein
MYFAIVHAFVLVIVFALHLGCASTSYVNKLCRGNLESFDKKILQSSVTYWLSYSIDGPTAKIRFAGREFDAKIEASNSKSWEGHWIKRMDDGVYFSYLPDEGGTIKFMFEGDRWFSGNCND